jgi:hypothetical protein
MDPTQGPVPAVIIHPECPNLRSALSGAFHLSPLPPHKPVKTHPEKDLVDAARYGEDNIRQMLGERDPALRAMARQDERVLRAVDDSRQDDIQARQREKWRQIVEGI